MDGRGARLEGDASRSIGDHVGRGARIGEETVRQTRDYYPWLLNRPTLEQEIAVLRHNDLVEPAVQRLPDVLHVGRGVAERVGIAGHVEQDIVRLDRAIRKEIDEPAVAQMRDTV